MNQRTDIKSEAKKIKSTNLKMSYREKYIITIAILE